MFKFSSHIFYLKLVHNLRVKLTLFNWIKFQRRTVFVFLFFRIFLFAKLYFKLNVELQSSSVNKAYDV